MVGILDGKGKEESQTLSQPSFPKRSWSGAFIYGHGFPVMLSGFSPSSRM